MSGVYFLKFLKVIFLLSPFEGIHHSLFYLSIVLYILQLILTYLGDPQVIGGQKISLRGV